MSAHPKEDPLGEPGPTPNPRPARILDAASRCFSQKGFQNTTIIDVAAAAGVSRPLVYKYFGDKDRLIDSVIQSTLADWETLNAQPTSPTAASALEDKFDTAIDFVRHRPIFRSILQQDPQVVLRGHLEGLLRCRAVSAERTRAILRSGVASGEFRSNLDEEATIASLEMVLFGLLERALGIRPELTLEPSLERATIDLLLAGLRSESGAS